MVQSFDSKKFYKETTIGEPKISQQPECDQIKLNYREKNHMLYVMCWMCDQFPHLGNDNLIMTDFKGKALNPRKPTIKSRKLRA